MTNPILLSIKRKTIIKAVSVQSKDYMNYQVQVGVAAKQNNQQAILQFKLHIKD